MKTLKLYTNEYLCEKIRQCMIPLLRIEYFYGIFRFRSDELSSPRHKNILQLSLFISGLWLISFYVVCLAPIGRPMTYSVVEVVDELPWFVYSCQYMSSVLTLIFFQSKSNRQVIENFAVIDFSLHANVNDNLYTETRSKAKMLSISFFFMCVIFFGVDYLIEETYYIEYILYLIIHFQPKLQIFVFCQVMFMVRQRISLINSYFLQFLKNNAISFKRHSENVFSKVNIDFIGRISDNNCKIRDLILVYYNLAETYDNIVHVFSLFAFMAVVGAFVFIISTITSTMFYYKTDKNIGNLFRVIIWGCIELFSISVIAYYCDSIMRARDKLKKLVQTVSNNYSLPKQMRVQAKLFNTVTEMYSLRFVVFNMFSVDLKLILTFVSVCTSYVVLTIQICHLI